VPAALTSLSWLALAYNPLLYGALPAAFSTSKLFAWSAYHQTYNSAATVYNTASYGAPPRYGSGVLYGTSMGLNRSMISILRDVQAALDPNGTSALAASWGGAHLQPCAPWGSANNYPGQQSSSAGFGRAWLGVTCNEWDLNINAVTAQYGGLSDLNLGLASPPLTGTIPVQLCELFPSITFLDLSENALVGALPTCFGQQPTVVSGRFKLSVFDNLVRAPPHARCCRTHVCCSARDGGLCALLLLRTFMRSPRASLFSCAAERDGASRVDVVGLAGARVQPATRRPAARRLHDFQALCLVGPLPDIQQCCVCCYDSVLR
jgi:hypothetical protein